MRVLAILGVKNEGAFLLEWLAHHRACGFTDFLVFSNDCSDGTDLMLDRLAAMGWLTPCPQRRPACRRPAMGAAEGGRQASACARPPTGCCSATSTNS